MCWVCIIPVLLVVLFLVAFYWTVRSQVGHKLALERLPLLFVLVVAALGIGAMLPLLPADRRDYAFSGSYLLFSLWLWVFLAVSVKRAAPGGEMLLDIGRPPASLAHAIIGGGGTLVGGVLLIMQGVSVWKGATTTGIRDVAFVAFVFSLSMYVLFLGLSRWAIKERGIMLYGRVLRWERIQGFEWDAENPCMLVLNVKRRLPWWRSGYVRVPADKRDAVNEVLQRKLSAGSPPVGAGSPGLPSRCAFKE